MKQTQGDPKFRAHKLYRDFKAGKVSYIPLDLRGTEYFTNNGDPVTDYEFRAVLVVTLKNVIDPESFWMKYDGNAKAMLLDVFDGPVDIALNAEDVLLTEASEI